MKIRVYRSSIAILLFVAALPLSAGEEKANIALVSDYIFRGVSLSNNSAVLQGSYEYDYGNSITVGTWLSSLPDEEEYDLYARHSSGIGNFGYSAGFIYYGFTGATVVPAELNLALSLYGLSVMSSRGEGVSYNEAAFETGLSGVGIRLHYGFDGTDPDYSLRLSRDMGWADVELVYASKIDSFTTVATDIYALSISKDF